MNRWTRMGMVLLLMLAASTVVYWRWPREKPEAVTVVKATLGHLEQTISATGSVEAQRKVLVTADPGARVAALYFNEQDLVKKGQVLAKMDDIEFSTQRHQTEAALNLAEANLSNAEDALKRAKSLYAKGYLARQEVDSAARQVDLFRTQIQEHKAALQLLKAKIERSIIRAPISGAITRKLVEVGGVVSDSSHGPSLGAPGQLQPLAIAEIADLEGLEFHADVDQTDIGAIKRGQHAVIALDAFPDRHFTGTVQDITLSSLEEMSGRVRYQVRVRLEPYDAPLRLGMTGTVDFILARKDDVLTLPAAVVLQREDKDVVFVADAGHARLQSIRIGLRNDEVVEVLAGLQPGDLVIDQGRTRVKDGQAVHVLPGGK